MDLFYPQVSYNLIGFADVRNLFDLHRGQSQTRYIFTYNDATIS